MPDTKQLHISKWLWITLLVIILDQVTKIIADNMLAYHSPVPVIPMLNFTLLYNKGAAFSFLASQDGWQRWFFLTLTSAVSVFLYLWLRKLHSDQVLQYSALSMILGGALGNLIDRAVYGHVIDFIDVHYMQQSFPAFNIADSAITVGAILLIYDTLVNSNEER